MRFFETYTVLFVITFFAVLSPLETVIAEDYFHKSFAWYYEGSQWTWDLNIPKSLYNSYRRVSVSERTSYSVGDYDFLVTTQDSYVKIVADGLREAAENKGYEPYDEVSFILAFVQSLPYTSDSVTTGYDEYPRFPVETLVDGGGDCEDTSILFAAIVLVLGYGAIFISPPSHVAVGVLGKDLSGYYWTYSGRRYYYCETTGENWRIGDLPDELQNTKAYLSSIDQNNQYIPNQALSNPAENGPQSFTPLSSVWRAVSLAVVISGAIIVLVYVFRKLMKTEVTTEKEKTNEFLVLSSLNAYIKQDEVRR